MTAIQAIFIHLRIIFIHYEGGTHESGFKTALTRVINDYARKNGLIKEVIQIYLVKMLEKG